MFFFYEALTHEIFKKKKKSFTHFCKVPFTFVSHNIKEVVKIQNVTSIINKLLVVSDWLKLWTWILYEQVFLHRVFGFVKGNIVSNFYAKKRNEKDENAILKWKPFRVLLI